MQMHSRWVARTGWRWNPGASRWVLGSIVAIGYAFFYGVSILQSHWSIGLRVLAMTLLVLTVLSFSLLPPGFLNAPLTSRWATVGVLFVLCVSQLMIAGSDYVGILIYPGIIAGALLPNRQAIPTAFAIAGLMLVIGNGDSWQLAVTEVSVSLWMLAFMSNVRLSFQLRAAQQELADAAVADERRRIARDLHDILGHSLTAISVKAALAEKLTVLDAGRAASEAGEIGRIARAALADVRRTASGMRETSLAGELAVARSILSAAGILATLPTAVDQVDERGRSIFGFVIREAVTNVVRHSGAKSCTVDLGHDWVQITDDGCGSPDAPGVSGDTGGHGLVGLGERVGACGGELVAHPLPSSGFRVRAELGPRR